MALPTHGRVLLDTTAGDVDIELWSKVRDVTTTNDVVQIVIIYLCRKHRKRAGISSRWPWKVCTVDSWLFRLSLWF